MDIGLLAQVLAWVASAPGAGALTFWLMEKVPEDVLSSEEKRYVSLTLAAIISMAAFACSVALGYLPQPANNQAWVESLFAVAWVATGLSQVMHGRAKLRGK